MPDSHVNWTHAGIAEVKDNELRLPDKLFQSEDEDNEGIVSPGMPVFWSYETTVNILIISNDELKDPDYETMDFTKMGGESDNYRCRIPNAFFEDVQKPGAPEVDSEVPDEALVSNGERRHFMYNKEMAAGDTKSCYVLNDKEFNIRFENSDIWDEKLSQVPKFV